jgi:serine/threonine protein kinase
MEVTLQSFKNRFTYDPQKDLLGKGGYSEVYKAFDNEDQIYVALKIYQGDADSKYNLSNEIRKFKRLRHANVIEHIEAYEVVTGNQDIHGNPIKYQVGILEYANAGTLADLMKTGKLIGKENEAQLESIAKDIIAGLEYLHSKNIIHRDLKPSNILLFKDGDKITPKICDFGIAKVMDNATAVSTQLVGTIEYMAPEYFRTDNGEIGKESDLWSLGVILLEASTGKHPFGKANEGYTNGQIINNIIQAKLSSIDTISNSYINNIIINCLQLNKENRYIDNEKSVLRNSNNLSDKIEKKEIINEKNIVENVYKPNSFIRKLIYYLCRFDFGNHNKKTVVFRELLILILIFLMLLVFYRIPTRFGDFIPSPVKNDFKYILNNYYGIYLLLSALIWYMTLNIRIFYVLKVKKNLTNLINQFLVFSIKNDSWKKTISKELIYVFSTIPISLFITCLVFLCIYFISYAKIKINEESIEKKDLAYNKYRAPIDFTEHYFKRHYNDGNSIHSSIGFIYYLFVVKQIKSNYNLPKGIAYNMGYKDFYYKLYNKVIIEKDVQWTNDMQKCIRNIHTAFKDFKLKENILDIDNLCIDGCETNPLFPQLFSKEYFIDKINNNIDDDKWLNFFYNERAIKNPRFLSYMKSKKINDKEDFRIFVKSNLTDFTEDKYKQALKEYNKYSESFNILYFQKYDSLYILNTSNSIIEWSTILPILFICILLLFLYTIRPLYIAFVWIINNHRQ